MLSFSNKKSYLGIDIGTSNIKLIELVDDDGIPRLKTYGYVEQEADIIRNDKGKAIENTIDLIKLLTKKSKTTSNKVIAALPNYSVFSSVINLPAMSRKDLSTAIHWEAKKFIPVPLKDMVLNWQILEDVSSANIIKRSKQEKDNKKKNYKILLTAALKSVVNKYITIFKSSGLELISLETESFAMIRSLLGRDKSTVLICDLGHNISSVLVVKEGIPVINRSVDAGGKLITNNIINNLKVDSKRAEQFKTDNGLSGDITTGIPKIITESLIPIMDEINYAMSVFQNQSNETVEKIILTGGTSNINGLSEYISKKLNKKCFIGNPWARIDYPEELSPVLQEIGASFSVCTGLAEREIEK